MEARLVEALRRRLDGLELSMAACRRDLLADFARHYRRLLRDASPETAAGVRRAIAASVDAYPILRPQLDRLGLDAAESPPSSSPAFQSGPSLAVSRTPVCAYRPARPRERETELQGLFTPTYLPLLGSSPIPPLGTLAARAPGSAPATCAPARPAQPTVPMDAAEDQLRATATAGATHASPPPLALPALPADAARAADNSRSSVSSDKSDYKPPRSALRRSSSTSKTPQSPRRVRFEFMGAEVLPTTSPQPAECLNRRSHSPGMVSDDEDDDGQDSTALASNLGGDTAEDEPPPPRKVSSSDALRALSRTPLEEGVVWTVVNANMDDSSSEHSEPAASSSPADIAPPLSAADGPIVGHGLPAGSSGGDGATRDDEDESSDGEFLAMAQTKASRKKPPPPANVSPKAVIHLARFGATLDGQELCGGVTKGNHEPKPSYDDDAGGAAEDVEELFHFETAEPDDPSRPRPEAPRPPPREDGAFQRPELDNDESDEILADASENQTSTFATSPAVPIPQSWGSQPLAASKFKFAPGSLGSYKGQPLMMPIVRDPKLLEQAASECPDVDDRDDRIAMEEGSPPQVSSTPFSFKERFMMEEMMDHIESRKDKNKGDEGR